MPVTATLTVAAQLLLGGYRDTIGATNAAWLARRLQACDWRYGDKVLLCEMAPAAALPVLRRIFAGAEGTA